MMQLGIDEKQILVSNFKWVLSTTPKIALPHGLWASIHGSTLIVKLKLSPVWYQ